MMPPPQPVLTVIYRMCFSPFAHYLGIGISNLLNLLNPQAIVLGGGITKAREFFEEEMLRVLIPFTIPAV